MLGLKDELRGIVSGEVFDGVEWSGVGWGIIFLNTALSKFVPFSHLLIAIVIASIVSVLALHLL